MSNWETEYDISLYWKRTMSLNSYLKIDDSVIELAEEYQLRKVLTRQYFDDGLHIAIATIHKVDILVSWNFKHIVHFDKIRLFNSINIEMGYKPIDIFSPREVATIEDD